MALAPVAARTAPGPAAPSRHVSLQQPALSSCSSVRCSSGAATALALVASRTRGTRVWRLGSYKAAVVGLRCSGQDAAVDVEALKREAARLRAEVDELKDQKEQQRKRQQELLFKTFDTDGSGAIDLQELQRGLKEFWGIELEESMAQRLLDARDDNRDGVLQPDEFDLQTIEDTYNKLREDERAKQASITAKEREKLEREAVLEEYLSSLPETNEDTGILTRLGSVVAYILPAIDSLRFSAPVASEIPQLRPFFKTVALDMQVLDQVSYGLAPILIFIVFQGLANNKELPKLLRYNMRQSVILTVALFVPGILMSLANLAAGMFAGSTNQWGDYIPGKVPSSIADPLNTLVFFAVMACIVYSCTSSLLGAAPTAIPFISAEAERTMAQTRDSELEARLRKQLDEAERKDNEKQP